MVLPESGTDSAHASHVLRERHIIIPLLIFKAVEFPNMEVCFHTDAARQSWAAQQLRCNLQPENSKRCVKQSLLSSKSSRKKTSLHFSMRCNVKSQPLQICNSLPVSCRHDCSGYTDIHKCKTNLTSASMIPQSRYMTSLACVGANECR